MNPESWMGAVCFCMTIVVASWILCNITDRLCLHIERIKTYSIFCNAYFGSTRRPNLESLKRAQEAVKSATAQ